MKTVPECVCTHNSSVIESLLTWNSWNFLWKNIINNWNWILFKLFSVCTICSEFPCSSFDKFNFRSIKNLFQKVYLRHRHCSSILFERKRNVRFRKKCKKNIRKHIKLLRSPLSINLLLDFFPFRCVLSTGFMKVSPLLMVRWAFLVFWMSSEEKSIKQISESGDGIARRGSSVIISRLGFPHFHEKFNACFIPFYAQLGFTTARHKKML